VHIDIYPVGWLAAIKEHRLRDEWRYFRRQMQERCGTGWTRRSALRSLRRRFAGQSLALMSDG
jgi:hypothetical protein